MRPLSKVLPLLAAISMTWVAGAGCRTLSQHPIVIEAVEEVRGNSRVAEALGAPVACSSSVRGTAHEANGIATLEFDATGTKAKGIVVVEGKKTGGEWGVTMLELRHAGGAKISLTSDLEARTGTDTPKFDPSATPANATPVAPPGDIEIVLPPGPPGQ